MALRRSLTARDLGLAGLGLASLLAYHWLFGKLAGLASATWVPLPAPVGSALWGAVAARRPELDPAPAAQQHAAAAVELLVGMSALYLLYLLAVWLARGRATLAGTLVVFGFGALFQGLGLLAPYALSGDVYSYAIYGRIFAVYGGSPYLEVPAQYPGDLYYDHVYWKFVPSFYGPLWTLISGALVEVAGHRVGLGVLLFRALAAGSALGAAGIVYLVLRGRDPNRALVGAALVAWCPFVAIESGLGAHNDALMAALMVAALGLAAARRPALAVGAVVLAGLVKLTALALLPLLGIYLLRAARSWRARAGLVARSALVSVLLAVAIVAPTWAGPATFSVGTLGSGADRYVNSLGEVVLGELRLRLGATRDDLEVPLQFAGWWVGTHRDAILYERRDGGAELAGLPPWTELLVVGPEREKRLRVFDPASRLVGYVDAAALGPIDPPADLLADPEVAARQRGPSGSTDLQEANRLIRLAGWGAFGLVLLLGLALGTGSLGGLAVAWAGLCLVLEYVTLTWTWPWYLLWGLLPAALVPRSRVTRLTVWLGWGLLLAYAALGFQNTRFWYLHNYRALPMFLLPLVLFVADEVLRWLGWGAALASRQIGGRLRPRPSPPPAMPTPDPSEAPTLMLEPPTVMLDPPTLVTGAVQDHRAVQDRRRERREPTERHTEPG